MISDTLGLLGVAFCHWSPTSSPMRQRTRRNRFFLRSQILRMIVTCYQPRTHHFDDLIGAAAHAAKSIVPAHTILYVVVTCCQSRTHLISIAPWSCSSSTPFRQMVPFDCGERGDASASTSCRLATILLARHALQRVPPYRSGKETSTYLCADPSNEATPFLITKWVSGIVAGGPFGLFLYLERSTPSIPCKL